MKLNELFPSNYLSKEDIAAPVRVKIESVEREEITGDNGKELKPVVRFHGGKKGLILNRTNGEIIAALYGDDTTAWIGAEVELWVDPTVTMHGKIVGGLRVRAPQEQQGDSPF